MKPFIILAGAIFALTKGWLPILPTVPVMLGLLVATALAGWAAFRHRRGHAILALPLLAIAVTLLTVGPLDVRVSRLDALGLQVVPVVYGLPAPDLVERGARGEVDLRGCIVRGFPKTYTVRIGLNPAR